tara:strand:+ start:238 stop:705 length:468 start_codon:yes stop_codon:yes gene_type:complete
MTVKSMDELLVNEAYSEIISECEKKPQLSDDHKLFLGIAYYKTAAFEKAESIFELLNRENPTNETLTYSIICKIKTNNLLEALKEYEALCESQNKILIQLIQSKQYQEALNLTLFLKSIPLELPKKESSGSELIDFVLSNDYSNLSLKLAEFKSN